ncbi:MAG: SHOCT domain-containing protein [Desulfonatronovibrionaceae bacterium]
MFDLDVLFWAAKGGDWSRWPFGPGFTSGWLLTLSKFVFIGLILAVILLALRFLFGPGGPFRDKELEQEAKEEKQRINEAVDILRRRLAAGEISEEEFEHKKRLIRRG